MEGKLRPAGKKTRIKLLDQLVSLFDSGIPASEAILLLNGPHLSSRIQEQLTEASRAASRGEPLVDAFHDAGGPFDHLELAHLLAGEKSGKLGEACQAAAERLESQRKTLWIFYGGMIYPAFLIHFAVLVPIPDFTANGPKFPTLSEYFLSRGLFFAVVYGSIFLGRALWSFLTATEKERERWHGVLLHIPVLGHVLYKLSVADFLETFISLQDAGLMMSQSMRVASYTAGNRCVGAAAHRMAPLLEEGTGLAEAFAAQAIFSKSSELIQRLEVGERSGSIVSVVGKLAAMYKAQARTDMKVLSAVIPVLCYFGAAAYIGYLYISFFVDYYGSMMPPH